MNARILTTLLAVAVLAVPAAVPASQPANIRLDTAPLQITATPATTNLATLLANPHIPVDLAIVLPTGHDTLHWIDQDPFAL